MIPDVGLPGMNGRQLAEVARQMRPGLKVLIVTGHAEMLANHGGFLAPGMDMLTRPFVLETLAAKIRTMIDPRQPRA
jgi:DNA-binding response OmpR family regulator